MRRLHIVLAEDDADLRRVIAEFLKSEGHQVLSVETGTAALQLLMSKPVDLVISDVDMPDGSGLWLLEQIHRATLEIPLILISGGKIGEREALAAGAHGFLPKPFAFSTLKKAIRNLDISPTHPERRSTG